MSPLPVTVRLLDPPIHEFLPSEYLLVEDLEHLHHLREILRGMQVLSDAVTFMNQTQEIQSLVQQFTDPVLVDQAIAKKEAILRKVRALHEVNPMLGHRGVRLGLTFPEDLYHADPGNSRSCS